MTAKENTAPTTHRQQHAPSSQRISQPDFLPMSREEMEKLGWSELDVLLVSGDAYVDHPSFAMALLGRFLTAHGFRTGIIAQPPWQEPKEALEQLRHMGRPRLFAGISAGAVDSLLAHYTAFRKKRSDDAYTPGGKAGARPNRALTVYANLLRQAFPGLPLVIGGIEASLRRISHYDFWSDSLRRSILLDSKADLLIYGMGETPLLETAHAAEASLLESAENTMAGDFRHRFLRHARRVPGTVSAMAVAEAIGEYGPAPEKWPFPLIGKQEKEGMLWLPSHEAIAADPKLLVSATLMLERQVHQSTQLALQQCGDRVLLLTPPPAMPDPAFLDALHELPYSRIPHPAYTEPVPAWEMIRTSITSHRGCGGGCAFCALALHQGRKIISRSRESILREARTIARGPAGSSRAPGWAGSISDVGGPTANMWQARCTLDPERCTRASCLHPRPCPGFSVAQDKHIALLREIARLDGVRHVRIASGVRFDLALLDDDAMAAYTMEFTGGQLTVAPEHTADAVLSLMRKPSLTVFEKFLEKFTTLSRRAGKQQFIIPYLMSAHPGCTDEHMRQLAAWLRERNWQPQQVQCFIPTPGSLATAMYYAGVDAQGNSLYTARSDAERLRQHFMLAPGRSAPARQGKTAEHRGRQPERAMPFPRGGNRPSPKKKHKKTRQA